jgi:hypothetical protein
MDSNTGSLGKLLPRAISAKRRRKKQQQWEDEAARALNSRQGTDSDGTINSTEHSQSNGTMADDEVDTSFTSYDSDPDQ